MQVMRLYQTLGDVKSVCEDGYGIGHGTDDAT